MQFNADDHIGTIGVIVQHVVLDLVVIREAEFAVGALWVGSSMLGSSPEDVAINRVERHLVVGPPIVIVGVPS